MAIRAGNAPFNVQAVTPAGTALADAAQIPANSSPALILATGDGTAGIKLPKAAKGKVFWVKNLAAAATLNVYPGESTDAINAIAAGSAITMAAATCAAFIASSDSQWYTSPLLPS